VREDPVEGVLLSGGGVARTDVSCGERLPSFDNGAPSMDGVSCLGLLQAVRAASPAPSESTLRRLGSFIFMNLSVSRDLTIVPRHCSAIGVYYNTGICFKK
jgi:hypothetical protein